MLKVVVYYDDLFREQFGEDSVTRVDALMALVDEMYAEESFQVGVRSGFFLTFSKKTQRTGSNCSHLNFKTHFIFNTFVVNEQKVLLFALTAPKITIFGAFLPDFPPNSYFFQKTNSKSSKLQGFF